MSHIRWFKVSEALARLGHDVDIATAEFKWRFRRPIVPMGERLRRVPISRVHWNEYDVVKTLFHRGFRTLEAYGGQRHSFIIAKLGSVVGPVDMAGIYFYGRQRAQLYETQARISARAKYVTVLSEPARGLWRQCFGAGDNILVVPGAAELDVPASSGDPYPRDGRPRCVFAGNFYAPRSASQPEAHRVLVDKLNVLGKELGQRGVRLYVVGPGDARSLDRRYVAYLGVVPYVESWDYLRFADVGLVVAAGPFMHNNESTKIYHYLRAGLPVVSEAGFPNDRVIEESGLGFVVENGDLSALVAKVLQATQTRWDKDGAIRYVMAHHTWDQRVQVYDRIIRRVFPD